MDTIGFLEVRGHFRKKLIGGNTDIHGEAERVPYLVFDCRSGGNGTAVRFLVSGKIHVAFINADLFDSGTESAQKFHQPLAVGAVQFMIRRNQQKMGAFLEGMGYRFSGGNMVCLGWDGFGQDDAVAAGHIAADNGGDFPQIQSAAVFQLLYRSPGKVGGVDVDVENERWVQLDHLGV